MICAQIRVAYRLRSLASYIPQVGNRWAMPEADVNLEQVLGGSAGLGERVNRGLAVGLHGSGEARQGRGARCPVAPGGAAA